MGRPPFAAGLPPCAKSQPATYRLGASETFTVDPPPPGRNFLNVSDVTGWILRRTSIADISEGAWPPRIVGKRSLRLSERRVERGKPPARTLAESPASGRMRAASAFISADMRPYQVCAVRDCNHLKELSKRPRVGRPALSSFSLLSPAKAPIRSARTGRGPLGLEKSAKCIRNSRHPHVKEQMTV